MVLKSTKPKNTKFNKYFRPLIKDKFKKRDLLYTGGIICKESGYITDVQLQAIVLSIKRILKKRGKVILRVFPHRPITKKPIQVRMGKGKGPIVNWLQVVYPGSVLLEINLISGSNLIVKKALKSVQCKLGFKSKVIVQ